MASKQKRAAPEALAASASGGVQSAPPLAQQQPLVIMEVGGEAFAFRLDLVAEIVRAPELARMPLAPRSLLGLANLRGRVLPVVSLRALLGFEGRPPGDNTRVIVLNGASPVGFAVDRVKALTSVAASRIEQDSAGAGATDPELLDGVIKGGEGETATKVLNPERLLRADFVALSSERGRGASSASAAAPRAGVSVAEAAKTRSFVSFDLGQQEYAVPLDGVREIMPLPEDISEVARSETAVLGVVTLRDRLLPLVSLRTLLGMASASDRPERAKVVVLAMGDTHVGVVADRTREILHVEEQAIDPAPALLTRGAGDAEITAVCRLEGGRRLVAVLSPEKLFRTDVFRRVLADHGSGTIHSGIDREDRAMAEEQFVVFRLGTQEYGLPIAAVEEIARLPEAVTKLPKAPAFIDGVVNLRGNVVPIVDLRRRFELGVSELAAGQRILVLSMAGAKTGFLVDGVREVLKIVSESIQPAPEVSAEQMRLVGRVATIGSEGRMILLVDPAQLLDRMEADVLAKFERDNAKRALPVS